MSANVLGELLTSIRDAVEQAKSRTLRLANLVLAAKKAFDDGHLPEEVIPELSGNLWLDWCHYHFRFSKRYCHLLAGCGEYLAKNTWFVQHVAQIDLYKVDVLRRIRDADKAKSFLSRNNLEELSREELSDRVNQFLGKLEKPKHDSDTIEPKNAQQLLLALKDADAFQDADFTSCVDLVEAAFDLCKAKANNDKVTPEYLANLAKTMRMMADEIDPRGVNP